MGIAWLAFGSISLFNETSSSTLSFLKYFWIGLGVLYLYLFFLEKKPYFIIENDEIIKTEFPKRRFDLKKLQRINRNNSGYKLVSASQEDFNIISGILKEEESLKLKNILEFYESKISE